MKRNRVIAGVAILAMLLVGGTLLMDRNRSGAVASKPAAAAGSAAQPGGTTSASGPQSAPAPQAEPVALTKVTALPPHSVAFIDPKAVSAESTYNVTFVPYGIGSRPNSLVIQILTSKPKGSVAHPFDFAGRNAVVDTSRLPVVAAVTKGGTYAGTIVLLPQASDLSADGVLAPLLIDASPAK